jgi:large subunit ribosomal protein L13
MQALSNPGSRKCRTPSDKCTKSYTPKQIERDWYLIDAKDAVVGRLASQVAMMLRGKHKRYYTPHADLGDHIVIVNAALVQFTGNKLDDKIYNRHTGHPGGLKRTTAKQILEGRFPERVLEKAVLRMMPSESPLARAAFKRLRVYAGPNHPHEAQQPIIYDFAGKNQKNMAGFREMAKNSINNQDLVQAIRQMFNEQEQRLGDRIDGLGSRIDTLHEDFVGLRSDVNSQLSQTNSLLKQLVAKTPK